MAPSTVPQDNTFDQEHYMNTYYVFLRYWLSAWRRQSCPGPANGCATATRHFQCVLSGGCVCEGRKASAGKVLFSAAFEFCPSQGSVCLQVGCKWPPLLCLSQEVCVAVRGLLDCLLAWWDRSLLASEGRWWHPRGCQPVLWPLL